MAGSQNYAETAKAIEHEIVTKGIILGIDWMDDSQVRALAHEAFEHSAEDVKHASSRSADYKLMAKVDLYGLAEMMLRTMEQSAGVGIECHGGIAWKSFAKALWAESKLRKPL